MFNYNVNINSEQVMSLKTDYYPCMINYNVNINPEQVMSLKTTIQLSLFHYNVNINFLTSYEPYNHFSTVSVPQIALFSNTQSGNAKIFENRIFIFYSELCYTKLKNRLSHHLQYQHKHVRGNWYDTNEGDLVGFENQILSKCLSEIDEWKWRYWMFVFSIQTMWLLNSKLLVQSSP